MLDTLKNIAQKLADRISAAYNFLDGKKRRIALVAGVVMSIAKPYTVIYKIAEASFYIFGSADAIAASKKVITNNLPSGLPPKE